ncbi:MAG: DoxX family protein [Candidatus Woesearchaeota archaeon]|jgi:putative oxidoreductase|nr:DoxX family protein [Candidatus Woesearchaeota archaeon]MDP7181370.1 DoxX family protein [Candidatus Woesearchaeota archaeon]MDP7198012.1 DoxX family protein [Candidatus Woesearchaeota archaeon]MDP7466846.1 DoxX family protein [Candidatus Woesearchaeota archaeon]MDP7647282.1 DoxX family protein [Candidatus Woesearchaeota archaeon]|tara:strand:- start:389 stop:805 length:417 start_codon:yes stop_codon:yes gene_type:complete
MKAEHGPLILRVFLGVAFIVAGLDKLLSYGMAQGMFTSMFGGAGTAVLVVAIIIEIAGGLALLTGYHTKKAASILAVIILVAFLKTFGVGQSAHFIGTLREVMVMNTSGANTAVNFAYFAGLLSLAATGSKFKAVKAD